MVYDLGRNGLWTRKDTGWENQLCHSWSFLLKTNQNFHVRKNKQENKNRQTKNVPFPFLYTMYTSSPRGTPITSFEEVLHRYIWSNVQRLLCKRHNPSTPLLQHQLTENIWVATLGMPLAFVTVSTVNKKRNKWCHSLLALFSLLMKCLQYKSLPASCYCGNTTPKWLQ